MSLTTSKRPRKRPVLLALAFLFCGNCFHRNHVDQRLVAVNHQRFERLKFTPEIPVADGPMDIFKTESARNEDWRVSVEAEFLQATWAFPGTNSAAP